MEIKELYDIAVLEIKNHIKTINNTKCKLLSISSAYDGVWLEHVYDSIVYGDLFNDYSIAINTFNEFINSQREGQYPCFIKDKLGLGYSQIQECVSFISLGYNLYLKTNDISFLSKLYNSSKEYVTFLEKYRMTLNLGLVESFVGYDTGHDNSMRLDNYKYKTYYSIDGIRQDAKIKPDSDTVFFTVDMNSCFYNTLNTLSIIASILNIEDEKVYYKEKAMNVKNKIFEYLYDKKDNYFYDMDSKFNKQKYISSTIFHLFQERVLDKNSDKELIDLLFNKYIINENEFYTKYPFPAVSISNLKRENYKMPNSWGYYSQALIALRCNLWMDYYGFSIYFNHILEMWVDGFIKNYDKYPFPQELDPISGISSGASLMYSTSILLYILASKRLKLV